MMINAFAIRQGDNVAWEEDGFEVSGTVQNKPSRVGAYVMVDLGGVAGDHGLDPYAEVQLIEGPVR